MAIDRSIRPTIVERPAQTYAGMRRTVTLSTFNEISDRIPELFTWLDGKGVAPAGPAFLRLTVIDMANGIDVEAGVPVVGDVFSEDPVFGSVLPAGRYVDYTHVGHPDGLIDATAAVLAWAADAGLTFDMRAAPGGDAWGCRLMIFLTDPADEPDPNNWKTELLFRLAD
jgi:effector-binding domain-containing protein